MKKSYFTTKEEAEKHKTEKQRVYYDTTKKMFYLRAFKTGNASSGRFDRFNTLKTLKILLILGIGIFIGMMIGVSINLEDKYFIMGCS